MSMVRAPSAEASPPARAPVQSQRLVQRCVLDFLVGHVARINTRHAGDLIGGAVFLAIKQASAAPRQATTASATPRAISVRAVAQSLGFSYETTRRRVLALEAAGLAQRLGDAGVALTDGALVTSGYRDDAATTHQAVLQLFSNLAALGVALPAASRPPTLDGTDLDLAVAALCDDFTLRVVEIGAVPNASSLAGLVFVALAVANAEPLTYDYELANRYSRFDTPPPDSARRPATITEIGQRLGLPHEVARRRMLHLLRIGHAKRVTGGYLASMETLQSPVMMESGMLVSQRFLQMTQALLNLGVNPLQARPA